MTITFTVTGTGQPSILYGTDTQNAAPPDGNLGPLRDGSALPWTASLPFSTGAQFYSLQALLQGAGQITATITVTAPGYPPLAWTATASGAFHLADVQVSPANPSGLSWERE